MNAVVPRSMNVTERAAWRWLVATHGYAPDTLKYQPSATPDFLGADGRGWEVKLVQNNIVTFYPGQPESLHRHGRCSILIWRAKETTPEAIIPMVPPIPGYWRQYRLYLMPPFTGHVLTLRLTDDEMAMVRAAAGTLGQSLQTWLSRAVDAAAVQQAAAPGGERIKAILDQEAAANGTAKPKRPKRPARTGGR